MNSNCVQPLENKNNNIVQYSSNTSFITGIMTSACFFSHIGKVGTTLETTLTATTGKRLVTAPEKVLSREWGPNGIITASQAAHGVQQIETRFHHLNKVHPQSQAHSTRSFHDNKKLVFQGLEEVMLLPSIGQTAAMKVSKILKSGH